MMTLDNRHKFALPYWASPRISSWAAKADNAGGKDDDAEDGDESGDEEDDEEDDTDLADLTVEQLRAQLKVTQTAVKTANDRSARRRSLLKSEREERAELQKKLDEKPASVKKIADDDKPEAVDAKAIERDVETRVQAAADERVKRVELKSELRGLIAPEKLERALKLIDMSDLSINRRGDVDGIDEAIEDLKADMPELFAKATRRRRAIGGRDEEQQPAGAVRERKNAPKGQTASERQAAMLLGR